MPPRSISVETPRFMTKRPSTARPVCQINHDTSSSPLDTSSKVFLTSVQQPSTPNPMPSPKKIFTSPTKPNRTTRTPKRNTSNQGNTEEEDVYLNMSLALLEVKDEQGNPLVKAIRKLKTNRFQAFLNKYKQAEEEFGSKIYHMKTLELELKDSTLNALHQRNLGNNMAGKILQQRDQRTPKIRRLPTAPDASLESSSPIKVVQGCLVSPITQRETIVSHTRAKSAHMEQKNPVKPQSVQGLFNSRPKTAIKTRNKSSVRPQTATAEEVKYGIDSSGLDMQARNETEPSSNEKKPYFFNKVPLFRNLAFGEESSRSRSRPKSHVLAISLNNGSSPLSVFRDKMSRTGYEKWSAIHSKREIDNTKVSLEKSRRERTLGTERQVDLMAIKEWFDALTVKGNPVSASHDAATIPNENPHGMQCSSRRQRMEEKIRMQQGLMEMGKRIMGRRGAEKEGKDGEVCIVDKLVKGKTIRQKNGSIYVEKTDTENIRLRKRDKVMSIWAESYSKAGLEGWNVAFGGEGMEKDGLQEENIDVMLREKAMESQEDQEIDIKDI